MEIPLASADKSTEKPTILLVDDTPENLLLISDLLRKRYKVKVANKGSRALTIAQADPPPDLILLDIMMPEMDGYEVCRLLKSNPVTRGIPVVFLTAQMDDNNKGLEIGAVGYLTKPVKSSLLMESIKTHLVPMDHNRIC
jgi:putative two-component system response regulator